MVETLYYEREATYPSDVQVETKGRTVTVSGANGKLTKTLPCQVTLKHIKGERKVNVFRYFSNKAQKSVVKTSKTLIQNMIDGVNEKFTYTARAFYNHHPIRFKLNENVLEVDNFLGARRAIKFNVPENVKFKFAELKDYYYISSNDKVACGEFFSLIHTELRARGFDRRRFNDGFYLISKTKV